ncbi:MAG: toll/interleukin-1 receptor domain-containing protein [Nannocystaceae bacterium]
MVWALGMADEYDVFFSYSSADLETVEAIAKRLQDERGLRPYLDEWYLVPGKKVQPALIAALSKSKAVAVFLGAGGKGPWQDLEEQLAVDHSVATDKSLFAVLLPGSSPEDVDGFIRIRRWLDFRERYDDIGLVAGILGCAPIEAERKWKERQARNGDGSDEPTSSEEAEDAWHEEPVEPEAKAEWKAAAELLPIVQRDTSGVVEHLEARLCEEPSEGATAERVVDAIVALGHGPQAGRRLVEACYEALAAVEQNEAWRAMQTLRELLGCWLPRRFGNGSNLRRRIRKQADGPQTPDLVVGIDSPLLIEALVAGEDERPMELSTDSDALVGVRSLPAPAAMGSEMKVEDEVVKHLKKGFGAQLPTQFASRAVGQFPDTQEGRRAEAKAILAITHRKGPLHRPRYFAPWPHQVAPSVLRKLKAVYPLLRMVYREGPAETDESDLLFILVYIFSQWQPTPPS